MAGPGLPRHRGNDGAGDWRHRRLPHHVRRHRTGSAGRGGEAAGHAVFRWDEVAPLLRGLYASQLDGFGREQAEPAITADTTVEEPIEPAKPIEEPATEAPAFHSDPVTVYPGEQNHLPYDVVVERLHVDQPEPTPPEPTPDVEPGEKPEHPVAIPVNGEWQTFPNQRTAEQAAYQEYRDNLRRNAQNFTSPTTIWARAAPRPSTRPMWRQSSC